ncbi:hypothetical protein MPL3365_170166 [Mesorhizobium plurifarium]|uniref:Uncharacterized protein n=1 Tax=Mesorhizobium plurifarium TaxID=69974 RepID=A0A090GTE4_MESPL|nr:hypothetical protein MPL3365_170166 [Mesorhizobium plurifarium]
MALLRQPTGKCHQLGTEPGPLVSLNVYPFPPDWRMIARVRSFSIPMSRCRPGSASFAKFRELRSARAVMRYLRKNDLPLPVRPVLGPAPHDVVWRQADSREC